MSNTYARPTPSAPPNPAFAKFTMRNFEIVAELERVASEIGTSMAQVAVNWTAHRPGVASVIVGATKLSQLENNIKAMEFIIPAELAERLDKVSAREQRFPYMFFSDGMQSMLHGKHPVSDKPEGYAPRFLSSGRAAGVSA
jgi:aryl-alcohol dehydrogenase-like predicted oxidoreductase